MNSNFPFYVLLHNIRSLHNVGSIFRTAECLGVTQIFLTGYTGKPPSPQIEKVALGAELIVPWQYSSKAGNVLNLLKKNHPNLCVIALENNQKKNPELLSDFVPKSPILLIVGEEVDGISTNLLKKADVVLEIKQYGQKESLNVSVAFGIAAYELSKKLHG